MIFTFFYYLIYNFFIYYYKNNYFILKYIINFNKMETKEKLKIIKDTLDKY